ncbi:hypothetical protein YPPY46_4072, partial [Yersinia pestis PY-46]
MGRRHRAGLVRG